MKISMRRCSPRARYGNAAVVTAMNRAIWRTGKLTWYPLITIPLGLPPRLPSTRIRIPLTAAAAAALSAMSRATTQRRAIRARSTRAIVTPNEPTS